jgi:rubrerythrin
LAASPSGRHGSESRGREATALSVRGHGSGVASPVGGGSLEEVAVCTLCGLVMRWPPPPECPACGGGFG